MKAKLLSLRDVDAAVVERWHHLATHALEPNPFFGPNVLMPAANHLEDDGDPKLLLVVEDSSEILVVLPVERVRNWHGYPLPILQTWLPGAIPFGTPLVSPNRTMEALRVLGRGLVGRWPFARSLIMPSVSEGAVSEAMDHVTSRGARRYDRAHRAALTRPPNSWRPEDWLTRKRGKEVDRCVRRLAEQLGYSPSLTRIPATPSALAQFVSMEGSGWKHDAGVALSSQAARRRFFEDACQRLDARGELRLLALGDAGNPVAMSCIVIQGGRAFAWLDAGSPEHSKAAPGVIVKLAVINWLRERENVTAFDTGSDPHNDLVNELHPDRIVVATIVDGWDPTGTRTRLYMKRLFKIMDMGKLWLQGRRRQTQ